MFNHITPPYGGSDHNEQAAEPPHSRRFDERGIALQTVIIMVVLLAIAGIVATVLFSRANDASDQLASAEVGVAADNFTSRLSCQGAGHGWKDGDGCKSAADWGDQTNTANCEALNPRWEDDPAKSLCGPKS